MPLKTQGNSILVPTEEGLVAVPIEEFDVVMVGGQVMLVAEENPRFILRWLNKGKDKDWWPSPDPVPPCLMERAMRPTMPEII